RRDHLDRELLQVHAAVGGHDAGGRRADARRLAHRRGGALRAGRRHAGHARGHGGARRVSPGDTPTPRRFYVHDDLTDEVGASQGPDSAAAALVRELFALVRRDSERVTILTLREQIEALVARGGHAPFALAIGIGRAGERVARQLHTRTGWFPTIRRVELTREEDGRGGYAVVGPAGVSMTEQLAGVDAAASLAVVDDTIFSGITL